MLLVKFTLYAYKGIPICKKLGVQVKFLYIRLGHLEKDINYKVKDLGVIKLQNLSCYLNVQLARHIKSPCF